MPAFFGERYEWLTAADRSAFAYDINSAYPTQETDTMATKKNTDLTTSETALTKASIAEGLDAAFASFLAQPDVSLVDTVLVGDPEDKKLPGYIGELIGPGRDIEIQDASTGEVRGLPTWSFHPYLNGEVVRNVTHVIPSSHQLNADFGRIHDRCKADGLTALVGVRYLGKEKTRRGLPVNNYQVFEKFTRKGPGNA